MKKNRILLLAALSIGFTACDYNEKYFEGFDEPKAESASKYTVEYTEKTFKEGESAKDEIIPWLNKKYFTCAEGSMASVSYQQEKTEIQEVVALDVDLERNVITKDPTDIYGWLNYATQGEVLWYDGSYSSNTYTEVSAYGAEGEVEAWFISPKVKIEEGDVLSFDAAFRYYAGDALAVYISDDFQGNQGSITNKNTHWDDVTVNFDIAGNESQNLVSVGEMPLDVYAGKSVYIAFVYRGSASGVTTTVQLDNILIKGQRSSNIMKTEVDEYDFKGGEWVFKRTVPSDLLYVTVTMQEADFQLIVDYVTENFDPGYLDTQKVGKGEYYYGASSAYSNWNAKGYTRQKYYDVDGSLAGMSEDEADAYCMERIKEGLVKFVELKYPGPVEQDGQYVNYKVISPIYASNGTFKYQATIMWDEEQGKYLLEALDVID